MEGDASNDTRFQESNSCSTKDVETDSWQATNLKLAREHREGWEIREEDVDKYGSVFPRAGGLIEMLMRRCQLVFLGSLLMRFP